MVAIRAPPQAKHLFAEGRLADCWSHGAVRDTTHEDHSPARAGPDDRADQKRDALDAIAGQLAPGSWDYARRPAKRELAATTVLALDLAEASIKLRTGPPSDDPQDLDSGLWAGIVPVRTVLGAAVPGPGVAADLSVPRTSAGS